MSGMNLEQRFSWSDTVEQKIVWGWVQTCVVKRGRIDIECAGQPHFPGGRVMSLRIFAIQGGSLIDYVDTGYALRQYYVSISFNEVVDLLERVQSTPVHLVAAELLDGLAKIGVLSIISGNSKKPRRKAAH